MEDQSGRRDRGFTLIELMVVIVIIALLATIVVPNLLGASDDARVATAKAQIKSFQTALIAYKMKFNTFPGSSEGLQALISNGQKNFMSSDVIPKDPWGNDYGYTCPGAQGHDYEIVSYGEDGQPGGSEYASDIVSWNLQGDQQQ